jgi:hypothetical protein
VRVMACVAGDGDRPEDGFFFLPYRIWAVGGKVREGSWGVFDAVARGLRYTPRGSFTCLPSVFSPSARLAGAKSTPSAWLSSYVKIQRSLGARLRAAQSGRFEL